MSEAENERTLLGAMMVATKRLNDALRAVADAGYSVEVRTHECPPVQRFDKLRDPSPQVEISSVTRIQKISLLPYLI